MLLIDEHTNANQYNTRASQEDIENIINAGDLVSEHIFRGAKFLQDDPANIIVPNVTKGLEALGEMSFKTLNLVQSNKFPISQSRRKEMRNLKNLSP